MEHFLRWAVVFGVFFALALLVWSGYQMRQFVGSLHIGREGKILFASHWTLKLWVGALLLYVAIAFTAARYFAPAWRFYVWVVLVYLLCAQSAWAGYQFWRWKKED